MERDYKLLIVDDETEILNTYRDYFAKRGFIVETAADGVEGLEKLKNDEFDVALVDIRMPKMDGIALAQKIDELGIGTEVIILTGHGERDEVVAALKARVRDWFDKSNIEMPKLFERVKQLSEGPPIEEIRRFLSVIPDREGRSSS